MSQRTGIPCIWRHSAQCRRSVERLAGVGQWRRIASGFRGFKDFAAQILFMLTPNYAYTVRINSQAQNALFWKRYPTKFRENWIAPTLRVPPLPRGSAALRRIQTAADGSRAIHRTARSQPATIESMHVDGGVITSQRPGSTATPYRFPPRARRPSGIHNSPEGRTDSVTRRLARHPLLASHPWPPPLPQSP